MLHCFADSFKSGNSGDEALPHNPPWRSAIHGAPSRCCSHSILATSNRPSGGLRIMHALGRILAFLPIECKTWRRLSGLGSGPSGVLTTLSQSTDRSQTEHADVEHAESGAVSTLGRNHRGLCSEANYAVAAARANDTQAADFRISGISSVRGGSGCHLVCCCN